MCNVPFSTVHHPRSRCNVRGATTQGQGHVNNSNPASYIAFTKQVASALRAVLAQHPRGKLPSTGASNTRIAVNVDATNWAAGSWNLKLANQSFYDGCVVHPYVGVAGGVFNAETVVVLLTASTTMGALTLSEEAILGGRSKH